MVVYQDKEGNKVERLDKVRDLIRDMDEQERAVALVELGKIGLEKLNVSEHLHGFVC